MCYKLNNKCSITLTLYLMFQVECYLYTQAMNVLAVFFPLFGVVFCFFSFLFFLFADINFYFCFLSRFFFKFFNDNMYVLFCTKLPYKMLNSDSISDNSVLQLVIHWEIGKLSSATGQMPLEILIQLKLMQQSLFQIGKIEERQKVTIQVWKLIYIKIAQWFE